MNRDQIATISNWLLNISVGVTLAGVVGPNLIQAELRYPLWPTTIVASSLIGLLFLVMSVYMRRS